MAADGGSLGVSRLAAALRHRFLAGFCLFRMHGRAGFVHGEIQEAPTPATMAV